MFLQIRNNAVHFSKNYSLRTRNSHFPFPLLSLVQFYSKSRVEKQISPAIFELLLHKHNFCPEAASQVATCLTLTRLKTLEKFDSTLSFFKESGFSNSQLEKMLKYRPTLLSANPDKVIKPKIKLFQDLNFSAQDIAEIITNDPDIMYRSLNNRVVPSLLVLKELLGSSLEVAKVLKISGWFLKSDIGKTMAPNIEFLKNCGIAVEQISWLMYTYPRCLLCKPKSMIKFVGRVDEMGISRSSKMFIHAIRVLSSMTDETWEQKLKAFKNLGFTDEDIVETFRKAPQVFSVSEEKMKKLKEILIASGKYDFSCVISHPTSLICSVENKYKPRLQVLGVLESRNLIKEWPSFPGLYKMPDESFVKKYVRPYLREVGDLHKVGSSFCGKNGL
ncbi:hypothetical protein ABFX02_14G277700 [Erythranthe guttata]